MGSIGPMQLGIVLLLVVLVFGTSKLKNIGKDFGGAVKGFKKAKQEQELYLTKKKQSLKTNQKHKIQRILNKQKTLNLLKLQRNQKTKQNLNRFLSLLNTDCKCANSGVI